MRIKRNYQCQNDEKPFDSELRKTIYVRKLFESSCRETLKMMRERRIDDG